MHKLILMLTCFLFCQVSFAQSEKIEVEGAVIIANSDPTNPTAGTIRWTGLDFEGFNGTVWESLTNCPTDVLEILSCSEILTGSTATFLFSDPFQTPTTIYDFFLGSTPGADDLYNNIGNGMFNGLSITVSNIPTDGRTLYLTWLIDRNGNGGFPNPITVTCTSTAAAIVNSECMTYAQIRTAGRAENCYNRDSPNAHLAEFLYMNPTVSHWTNDPVNEMICAIDTPEPGPSALQAPPPSGGNDAPMIEAFINNNSGAEIIGMGTYTFGSTIDINVPVKIWDMPSKLNGSIGIVYRVNTANVQMYRSLIDAQKLPSAYRGWSLAPAADNFVLSKSGIENIHHKNNSHVAAIWINGASDYHITCNKFNNLLVDFESTATFGPVARAILSSSNAGLPSPGGYIANNDSENILSSDDFNSASVAGVAFFTLQGYEGSEGTVKIIANRCVNAGKRLAKCQHPDVYIASNFWHWKDRQGPIGNRKMIAITNCQLDADRVTTINNRIKIEAEARYDALLQVSPQRNNYTYSNIHFDCNNIELIDTPPETWYAYGANFSNKDGTSSDTRNQLANCSFKDNIIRGPGGTNYVFNFGAGYIDDATGLDIDLSGNLVIAPILISVFRGSNAPLPQ